MGMKINWVDGATAAAALPAVVYTIAYMFDLGYAIGFPLAWRYIYVGVNEMIISVVGLCIVTIGSLELFHGIIGDVKTLFEDNNRKARVMIFALIITVVPFVFIYSKAFAAYTLLAFLAVYLVTYMISNGLVAKFFSFIDGNAGDDGLLSLMIDKHPVPCLLVFFGFVACSWSFLLGATFTDTLNLSSINISGTDYRVLSTSKDEIVAGSTDRKHILLLDKHQFNNCGDGISGCVQL